MKRIAHVLALVVLLVSVPAFAKDVCVHSLTGDDVLVFKNVKPASKPLSVVPLVGYMVRGGAAYPFHGSAVAGGNDKIAVGILIHAFYTVGKDLSIMSLVDPVTFSGFTKEDTNSDGVPDTEDFWAGTSCSSVQL